MDDLTVPGIGPERARRQYPFADLLACGTRLAMGSDGAVTTADPLEQLEVAITRTDPGNRGNAPFLPEQRLPLDVALDAFTAGSAYVNHDGQAGDLAVGLCHASRLEARSSLAHPAPVGPTPARWLERISLR